MVVQTSICVIGVVFCFFEQCRHVRIVQCIVNHVAVSRRLYQLLETQIAKLMRYGGL